jgi:hypothetical protein
MLYWDNTIASIVVFLTCKSLLSEMAWKNFTSYLFERQVKRMTLDIFIKKEQHSKPGYLASAMTAG